MNEFQTYEYVVRQKTEGKWLLARIGLIFLYVCFVLAWIAMGVRARIIVPLLALVPITTWMLIFFTWRLVSVEYEYSVTSGILTFTKVFGSRSKKKIFELPLRDAALIACVDDSTQFAKIKSYRPEKSLVGFSSRNASDVYFMLFEHKEKKEKKKCRMVYYFEATEKMLHLCRYYNPGSTVISK